MNLAGSVPGDAGFGVSTPRPVPIDQGILITRRGCVSLHSNSLREEFWRVPVNGWTTSLVALSDRVLVGPIEGSILELELADGREIRRIPYAGIAGVKGIHGDLLLLYGSGNLQAIDITGRRIWQQEIDSAPLARDDNLLVARHTSSNTIGCLDLTTGEERWRRSLPPEQGTRDYAMASSRVIGGEPSLAIVGDRVLAIPQNHMRVFSLSLDNGEIIDVGRAPFRARYFVVTEDFVYLKDDFRLSTFDHREMKEVDRIEFKKEVEPLYAGETRVTSNAFCLTEKTIFWNTSNGALVGLSRTCDDQGQRVIWVEQIPGALTPESLPPICFRDNLYFNNWGYPPQLICYQAAAPSS